MNGSCVNGLEKILMVSLVVCSVRNVEIVFSEDKIQF